MCDNTIYKKILNHAIAGKRMLPIAGDSFEMTNHSSLPWLWCEKFATINVSSTFVPSSSSICELPSTPPKTYSNPADESIDDAKHLLGPGIIVQSPYQLMSTLLQVIGFVCMSRISNRLNIAQEEDSLFDMVTSCAAFPREWTRQSWSSGSSPHVTCLSHLRVFKLNNSTSPRDPEVWPNKKMLPSKCTILGDALGFGWMHPSGLILVHIFSPPSWDIRASVFSIHKSFNRFSKQSRPPKMAIWLSPQRHIPCLWRGWGEGRESSCVELWSFQ